MPPLDSLPSCAMQSPPVMIGDEAVKNLGQAPEKSSLRQSSLPFEASTQETTPPTPSVTTLPSATAGELRGPLCCAGGPDTSWAEYFSCQSSFPVAASRQRMASSASWR